MEQKAETKEMKKVQPKRKRSREKEVIYLWKAKCISRKKAVNAKHMALENEMSAT